MKKTLMRTLIPALLFALTHLVLGLFHLRFRRWVYAVAVGAFGVALLGLIISLIRKISRKGLRIGLLLLLCVALLLAVPYGIVTVSFAFEPEHRVEREGIPYLARVNAFLSTYVTYYAYKGPFLMGNEILVEEYYGKGGFDPIENPYGGEHPVIWTHYYDEDGNLITSSMDAQESMVKK